jgi:Rrf2 family protein
MRLSTRSTYGMRALVELALASGHGPVSAAHIAKRQDLSVAYLEQLLHRLKKQAMVKSVRGPRGGYVLAKDPKRITMAEVVHILDGGNGRDNNKAAHRTRRRIANTKVATEPSRDSHRHAQRIATAVWRCVHERILESLDAVTLQDLCDQVRTEAGEPLDHRYVFNI